MNEKRKNLKESKFINLNLRYIEVNCVRKEEHILSTLLEIVPLLFIITHKYVNSDVLFTSFSSI